MTEKETYPGGQRLRCVEGGAEVDPPGSVWRSAPMAKDPIDVKLEVLESSLLVLDEMTTLSSWPKEGIRRLILMAREQTAEARKAVREATKDEWLDYRAIRDKYHLGKKTALRLVAEGEIKAAEIDGRRKHVFHEGSIQKWLRKTAARKHLKSRFRVTGGDR